MVGCWSSRCCNLRRKRCCCNLLRLDDNIASQVTDFAVDEKELREYRSSYIVLSKVSKLLETTSSHHCASWILLGIGRETSVWMET